LNFNEKVRFAEVEEDVRAITGKHGNMGDGWAAEWFDAAPVRSV
jgi:hypothetical protein